LIMAYVNFVLLGFGIGLAGYSAARPIAAETQSGRIELWLNQSGLLFFIGLALIIAASVLMRRAIKSRIDAHAQGEAGDPVLLLAELKAGAAAVHEGLAAEPPNRELICDQIDALRDGCIQGLVDCKDALVAEHGMLPYAEFISAVSSAERNLNRSWSTLVDGYPAEARQASERAQGALSGLQLPSSV
jgi:hypothetical protein